MFYLMVFLYFAIPIASVVFFVKSLVSLLRALRDHREEPDSISPKTLKGLKIRMIIAAIVMTVLLTVTIGFAVLLVLAIAYM